jgi:hypothetical protein
MPDDPRKAIEYALTFLPGFFALKIALVLTDTELSELEFIFISVSLSVAIFGLTRIVVAILRRCSHWPKLVATRVRRWRSRYERPAPHRGNQQHIVAVAVSADGASAVLLTDNEIAKEQLNDHLETQAPSNQRARTAALRTSKIASLIMMFVITLASSLLIASLIEDQAIIGLAKKLPFHFAKSSGSRPLLALMDDMAECKMFKHDFRTEQPAILREKPYVRIYTSDGGIYEGFPRFWPTGKEPTEIYLSPACDVRTSNSDQLVSKHSGPGVFVTEGSFSRMEFLDVEASRCHTLWVGPADSGCKTE